jgi:putative membrane protein
MSNYIVAIEFVLVMVLLNIFVKPIFTIITIPITLFTLGFFLLFINAIMISIADYFVDGFSIDTFWHTLLFSFILSLSNTLFEQLTNPRSAS